MANNLSKEKANNLQAARLSKQLEQTLEGYFKQTKAKKSKEKQTLISD